MSKSHVLELSNVWRSILADVCQAYPRLTSTFEKDLIRCERLVKARGLPVFLVDFPAIGKHLDRCLSDGEYSPGRLLATSKAAPGVVTPKFLGGLYLLIFDRDGRLLEEPDFQAIYFLRQLLLFAKKYVIDCPMSATSTAVVEMVEHDATLPQPSSYWSDVKISSSSCYTGFEASMPLRDGVDRHVHGSLLATLEEVSRIVVSTLGAFSAAMWKCKHGPGVVANPASPNKYCWTNWSDRLESCFPIADYGYHSYSSWARARIESDTVTSITSAADADFVTSQEIPSELKAVPKTFSGPRLIAAEPQENMWCQQLLLNYLDSRIRHTWIGKFIALRDQTQNREMCRIGSVDGSLCTIDLSMASDCVTPDFVGCMFRFNPKLLDAFRATRSLTVRQQITRRVSEQIVLNKFSTMGNAYTFPVESLVFLTIVISAVLLHRKMKVNLENIEALIGQVSVYGDDLIVPSDTRVAVTEALEVLHFKVNQQKTFWKGYFRESCGLDSFRGVEVTPVYYRSRYDGNATSLSSIVAVTNRCYSRYLLRTAAYLRSTLPKRLAWVAYDSGAFGLKTRMQPCNAHLKRRWNKDLQRVEVQCTVVETIQQRTQTDGDYSLLQYFTEEPEPITAWESGFVSRSSSSKRTAWVPIHSLEYSAKLL